MFMIKQKVGIGEKEIRSYIQGALEGRTRFCVADSGGNLAWIENGIYSVKRYGMTKEVVKTPAALQSIFIKLVNKYTNFNYQGYIYTYQGGWSRYEGSYTI